MHLLIIYWPLCCIPTSIGATYGVYGATSPGARATKGVADGFMRPNVREIRVYTSRWNQS